MDFAVIGFLVQQLTSSIGVPLKASSPVTLITLPFIENGLGRDGRTQFDFIKNIKHSRLFLPLQLNHRSHNFVML